MPKIEYTSIFLREQAEAFVNGLSKCKTHCPVIYVGGIDSASSVREVLSIGCEAIQVGRALIREPDFGKRLLKSLPPFAGEGVTLCRSAFAAICALWPLLTRQ